MPREEFHHELATLDADIVDMGQRASEALASAVQALATRDSNLAQVTLSQEQIINALHLSLRQRTTTALALQAPVANDLREITAIQLVSGELERIGDHAAGIARRAIHLRSYPAIPLTDEFTQLGRQVGDQLSAAVAAFRDGDTQRARAISAQDDRIDQAYRALFSHLLEVMAQGGEVVVPGADMLLTAQALERVGDRVTNICEDIIFRSTGDIEQLN